MKGLQWIIIGIGIITGVFFLLSYIFSVMFFAGLIVLISILSISVAVGFLVVRFFIPSRFRRNIHYALLIPWITIFMFYIAITLVQHQSVDLILSVPLLFVFSSIGGSMAYHAEMKKNFNSI
ncbi:putative membrane protein [Mucilaginibacter sp. UYP25]|uniref:hypothetical protein n=1 Tax=unclassified Mucilaginibacter TaxID=2617802 RepID=UPI0033960656